MLSAYLDGELPADTRKALEALLAKDTTLRMRLERLRAMNTQLKDALPLHKHEGDALLAARIRSTRQHVTPTAHTRRMLSRRQTVWFAAAASLFGVAIGYLLTRNLPHETNDGWMTASGTLASALDTQPSGGFAEGDSATARVVLSFKASDGRFCRAFSWQAATKSAEGLACREAGTWQLVALEASASSLASEGYRPASSAAAAIDAAMDALGGSEPLDASTEAKLIAQAWRGQ